MERSKIINVVVDSSVIIKWFSHEQDSDKAIDLLNLHRTKHHIMVLPDLVLYEVANDKVNNLKFVHLLSEFMNI
jgi:predicted nucleic acid-binding protein